MGVFVNKLTRRLLLSGLAALMLTTAIWRAQNTLPAHAATGLNQQINFQGKLVNTNGTNIPDGTYNIEFKIYQDGDGVVGGADETLKWTETRLRNSTQGVTVTNGIFQANLGSVNPFGSSIDWDQDTIWLSINLGNTNATCTPFSNCAPDGEMSPMVRFTASPYALNSAKLQGLNKDQFVQLAQGLQVDSSTTNASIAINKTGSTANILQLQRGGADVLIINNAGQLTFKPQTDDASAFKVQKADGSVTVLNVDTTNTRVGIGTAAPTADLSFGAGANRTINVLTQPTADTAGNKLTVQSGTGNGTGAGGDLVLQAGGGGATNAGGGNLYAFGGAATGTGTNGNVILAHNGTSAIGKVGIGISSPQGTLHVGNGTSVITPSSTADDLVVENGTGAGGISILTPDGNFGNIRFGSTSNAANASLQASYSSGSPYLKIDINGTESSRFTSNGNVGIGSTGPGRKLDVLDASNPQLRLTHTDGSIFGDMRVGASGGFAFTGSNLTVNNSAGMQGSFTINNSTASASHYGQKLSVTSSGSTAASLYGQHISFTDATSTANTAYGLYVDATTANASDATYAAAFMGGNVGIGTTNPGAKLDIASATQMTSFTGTAKGVVNLVATTANGDYSALTFGSSAGVPGAKIASQQTANGTLLQFGTTNNYGVGITNTAMTINYDGNVGIGDATPNALLDVNGTMSVNTIENQDGNAGDLTIRTDLTYTNRRVVLQATNAGGANADVLSIASDDYGSTDAGVRAIFQNANVGIGTTLPTSILHTVATGAKTANYTGNLLTSTATSSTASVNKYGLEVQSTGTWNGTSANNVGLYVSSVTGGTNNYDAIFNGGGNVGIGTSTPLGNLDVRQRNNGDTLLYGRRNTDTAPTGNLVNFLNAAATTDLFKVDVNGNLTTAGTIAGSSSSYTAGSVIFAGSNGVLTQDASDFVFDTTNNALRLGSGATVSHLQVTGNNYANLLLLTASDDVFKVTQTGDTRVRTSTNSANAFHVQDSSQNNVLNVDTSTRQVSLLGGGAKTASYSGSLITNAATSSTASINKYGLEIQSTGTWNGGSANNVGLYVSSVTGGANNYDAIFNGGGYVGIGTAAPSNKLEVTDSAIDVARFTSTGGTGGIVLANNGAGSSVRIRAVDNGGVNDLQLLTGGSERVRVDASGNVGINQTVPTSVLHTVATGAKTANYTGNLLTNTATSSTASINKYGLEIQSTGTWNGAGATNVGLYVSSVTGGAANYDAIFNGGGNVGIGTATPSQKLTVVSATDTQATFRSTGANRANITIDNQTTGQISSVLFQDAGTNAFQIGKQTNNSFFIYDAANSRDAMRINTGGNLLLAPTGGNVGIGSETSPNNRLEVAGGATGAETSLLQVRSNFSDVNTGSALRFVNSASNTSTSGSGEIAVIRDANDGGQMIFRTGNSSAILTEAFRIDTAGNTGMGVTVPTAKLHVAAPNGTSGGTGTAGTTGLIVTGGNGGNSSTASTAGGAGGAITLTAGNGGNSTGVPGANGANITLQGGVGGTGSTSGLYGRIVLNSAGGNVGVGTAAPGAKLDVQGNLRISGSGSQLEFSDIAAGSIPNIKSNISTSTLDITGGLGGTRILNNTSSEVRLLVKENGNVGIGTTDPQGILHTVASGAKTANYSGNLLTNTATSSIASINKYGLEVQSTGTWNGTSANNVGLYVSSVTGGTNNYSAIFNGGNVGIGQSAPARPLHISQAGADTSNGGVVLIDSTLASTTNQQAGIRSAPYIGPSAASSQSYYGVLGVPNTNNANLSSATVVGIGSAPYIYGSATVGTVQGAFFQNYADNTSTITNSRGLVVEDPSKAVGATITSNTGLEVRAQTAGASNMGLSIGEATGTNQANLVIGQITQPTGTYSIYNSSPDQNYFAGNVGIGTTNAAAGRLVVQGTTSDSTAAALSLKDSGTNDLFYVRNDGRVGIGTTSTNARLEINNTGTAPYTTTGLLLSSTYNPTAGGTQTNFSSTVTNNPTSVANTAVGFNLTVTDANASGANLANALQGINITVNDTCAATCGSRNVRGLLVDTSGTTDTSALITTALFKGTTTTNLLVQNSAGTELLRADTTNMLLKVGTTIAPTLSGAKLLVTNSEVTTALRVGNGTNGLDFASGTRPSSSNPFFKGSSQPSKRITLTPEYPGAVMTAPAANNIGSMTSDFCSASARLNVNTAICNTAGDEHNYYSWTTTNSSTAQSYDIYVRYQVPSDFAAFTSSTAIQMHGWRDSTSQQVLLSLYRADGTICGTADKNVATWTSGTVYWTQSDHNGDETACSIAAGDRIVFKIRLTALNGGYARAGQITFDYYSNF
jgi:hypothetical protein